MSDRLLEQRDRCRACGFLPSKTVEDVPGVLVPSHPCSFEEPTSMLVFWCERCGYRWSIDRSAELAAEPQPDPEPDGPGGKK